MKKYGSKDIMRMESIKDKSHGEYMAQLLYAYNMSCAITEPGKVMARGYAAQEFFGEFSAIAGIFFERAHDLGGKNVIPTASVNAIDTSKEGIEAEYENIRIEEQPYSRRNKTNRKIKPKKTLFSNIIALGRINIIKNYGPKFNLYEQPWGIIEVWKNSKGSYKLLYTANYESMYVLNEKRLFKYDNKTVEWELIDYIETDYVSNLAPLYGKSIAMYNYD